jgi:hypothetical protein
MERILKEAVADVYETPIDHPIVEFLPKFEGEDSADTTVAIVAEGTGLRVKYGNEMAQAAVHQILRLAEERDIDTGTVEAFFVANDGWSGMPEAPNLDK